MYTYFYLLLISPLQEQYGLEFFQRLASLVYGLLDSYDQYKRYLDYVQFLDLSPPTQSQDQDLFLTPTPSTTVLTIDRSESYIRTYVRMYVCAYLHVQTLCIHMYKSPLNNLCDEIRTYHYVNSERLIMFEKKIMYIRVYELFFQFYIVGNSVCNAPTYVRTYYLGIRNIMYVRTYVRICLIRTCT